MNKSIFKILIMVLIVFSVTTETFALSRGDKGYGLTVFEGDKISKFQVEFLGSLKNSKLSDQTKISGKSYLIRVSGEEIEKSGGISQGMSGSPVYFNDILTGAISSCWSMSDHKVGLMTPIEEMRKLYCYDSKSEIRKHHGFKDVSTPVFVTGIDESNLGNLKTVFKKAGCDLRAGLSSDEITNCKMEPGQAIGIMLAYGDINITTIGTLTEIRNNRHFLGFGHPFMKRGEVSYFLAPAKIYHTFDSIESPFKVGAPGKPVGCVTQDRNQGVSGVIGVMPRVIHLNVFIKDQLDSKKGKISLSLVRDPLLISEIVTTAVMQAIDNVSNRELEQILSINFNANLMKKNGEIFKYSRTNCGGFEDPKMFIESEINHSIANIINNPQCELIPLDMNINIDIAKSKRMQSIKKIDFNRLTMKKGEDAELSITLERFREEDKKIKMKIPVPVNLDDGEYEIVVSAGTESTVNTNDFFSSNNEGRPKEESLGTYLYKLANDNVSNIISVKLLTPQKAEEKRDEIDITAKYPQFSEYLKDLKNKVNERKIKTDHITEIKFKTEIPTKGTHSFKIIFGDDGEEL